MAKSSIAPEVQKRMDAELLPIIRKAVADFDREATRVVSLQSRVKRVFRELVRPRRADHGRWMTLEPRQAALELRAEGDAIVAEPALSARLSYHERKPDRKPPALPARQPLSKLRDKRLILPEALTPPQLQILLQAI